MTSSPHRMGWSSIMKKNPSSDCEKNNSRLLERLAQFELGQPAPVRLQSEGSQIGEGGREVLFIELPATRLADVLVTQHADRLPFPAYGHVQNRHRAAGAQIVR